ncbi:unnamed protein product [Toxocara canis]|nr:unnamed protein product [Toxocara canis]
MLIKRFRGEPHAQNVTPMAQQQHPNINSSVANTPQKHAEANNGATSSSSMLSAEEMNAWIVHGGYSPRVVQSYCRPDVGAIYRGDCY